MLQKIDLNLKKIIVKEFLKKHYYMGIIMKLLE